MIQNIICCATCLPSCNEWIILFLGTIFWTFILYLIKPKLEISTIEFYRGELYPLKVKIKNNGLFTALNLKIELCAIDSKKNTYHFKFDYEDFLMLWSKESRNFKTNELQKPAFFLYRNTFHPNDNIQYNQQNINEIFSDFINQNYIFRARVYAQHEYSGFGKAIESEFIWNKNTNKFDKIISKLNKRK